MWDHVTNGRIVPELQQPLPTRKQRDTNSPHTSPELGFYVVFKCISIVFLNNTLCLIRLIRYV